VKYFKFQTVSVASILIYYLV